MRVAAQVHLIAEEDVLDVIGMEWIDERVLRFGAVDIVVALDGLVEEGQA
jgi:hypothetical protein